MVNFGNTNKIFDLRKWLPRISPSPPSDSVVIVTKPKKNTGFCTRPKSDRSIRYIWIRITLACKNQTDVLNLAFTTPGLSGSPTESVWLSQQSALWHCDMWGLKAKKKVEKTTRQIALQVLIRATDTIT